MGDGGGADLAAYTQAAARQLLSQLAGTRKRSEKALLAVTQEAYVKGVSTRKVDDLV